MSVAVRRYGEQGAEAWDKLTAQWRNGTFLHERRFIADSELTARTRRLGNYGHTVKYRHILLRRGMSSGERGSGARGQDDLR